ncbi:histidine kinase [Streptomyces tsukubensis]|uniref:Histidine kinase n=1 Tax=Streptomyces tsukubensis TaxID=83656 RepID=A0A1V4A7I3_9ACTN|nr:histidine kinase [Streptomyces tsukubensis]OON78351.1 histidine kinase [Streptomyces tsukubensis]QFR95113.1 histidine kinase [Streptomyces tsukubensis]
MAWNANVLFYSFPDPGHSYAAFHDVQGMESVSRAAVLERAQDGTLSVTETYAPDSVMASGAGGVVGALLGVLAGPVGILFGWTAGTLFGLAADSEEASGDLDALTVLSQGVPDGGNVLIVAINDESDPSLGDGIARKYGGILVRVPAGVVQAEVVSAQEAAEGAARSARARHRAERRDEFRERAGALFGHRPTGADDGKK